MSFNTNSKYPIKMKKYAKTPIIINFENKIMTDGQLITLHLNKQSFLLPNIEYPFKSYKNDKQMIIKIKISDFCIPDHYGSIKVRVYNKKENWTSEWVYLTGIKKKFLNEHLLFKSKLNFKQCKNLFGISDIIKVPKTMNVNDEIELKKDSPFVKFYCSNFSNFSNRLVKENKLKKRDLSIYKIYYYNSNVNDFYIKGKPLMLFNNYYNEIINYIKTRSIGYLTVEAQLVNKMYTDIRKDSKNKKGIPVIMLTVTFVNQTQKKAIGHFFNLE